MTQAIDFAERFARLAGAGQTEDTILLGGVNVRLVRLAGGAAGGWDRHAGTSETVLVWRGDFTVAFRDRTLDLAPGQCCVVPRGAEHRGSSRAGAEVILLQQAG